MAPAARIRIRIRALCQSLSPHSPSHRALLAPGGAGLPGLPDRALELGAPETSTVVAPPNAHHTSTALARRAMEAPSPTTDSTSVNSSRMATRRSPSVQIPPQPLPAPPSPSPQATPCEPFPVLPAPKRRRRAPGPAAPAAAPDVAGQQRTEALVSSEPSGEAGSAAPGGAPISHPATATLAPRAQALLLSLQAHDTEEVLAALNLHCSDPSFLPGDMPRASSPASGPTREI